MLQRVDSDDENAFAILNNGKSIGFWAEREKLSSCRTETRLAWETEQSTTSVRRGAWLLWRNTIIGPVIVDRDQYSNDLMERVDCFVNGNGRSCSYDRRFKVPCTRSTYLEHAHIWCENLAFEFGGEWVPEYYDWDKQAVLSLKV